MTRLMYDGINTDASSIPTTAQLVAGYVDGLYAWSPADWARFPHSVHVEIAVLPTTNAGVVLDVEQGNGTPAQSVDWVLMRRAAGADPTVYCNVSTWPAVRSAFEVRGVPEPQCWIAQYDGVAEVPAGAVAKQYDSYPAWDLSVVADYWPGIDPAPPAPAPTPTPEDDMPTTTSVNGRAGLSWPAGSRHVVQVTYDPAGGDPDLRVVLALTTGPLVLALQPAKGSGSGVLELGEHGPACRGVILEAAAPGPVFDVCAV